jgi:hypothetical protein
MSSKIALAVGFANLSGADFASFLSEDIAALSALFETTNIAAVRRIPAADILFLLRVLRRTALWKERRRSVCARSHRRCGQAFSSWPRQYLEAQLRMPWAFLGQKPPIWFSRSTAKGLRSPVFSVPSLRECVTVKTCLRTFLPQAPMETHENPELVLLPEGGAIAFAPHRGQA